MRWLRRLRLFGGTKFVDAQAMALAFPETFQRPAPVALAALQVGDIVKVGTGDERFWTIIQDIHGKWISATIDNELQHSEQHGLFCDDMIRFERKHIFDIYE